MPNFTPTQQRIYNVLRDGQMHPQSEILKCLSDPLAQVSNIHAFVCQMRKQLAYAGQDIVVRKVNGVQQYYLVRLMGSSNE